MEQLTNLVVSDKELTMISTVLSKLMNDTNATSALLIDKSGQVVTTQGANTRRERNHAWSTASWCLLVFA